MVDVFYWRQHLHSLQPAACTHFLPLSCTPMAAGDNIIRKGTHLPLALHDHTSGAGKSDHCALIPSWFPLPDHETNDVDEATSLKRRRLDPNKKTSEQPTSSFTHLEQLITREIRNCDVCGRHVLWTPLMQQRCFEPSAGDETSPTKSIAESLPRFINNHISHDSPIPCTFCKNAHDFKSNESYTWCGTLYCGEECRCKGERNAIQGTSSREGSFLLPKLFFCCNRLLRYLNSIKHGDNSVVGDLLDSLNSMKQRFFTTSGSDSKSMIQQIGEEDCALMIVSLICCCCRWWVDDLLTLYVSSNNLTQHTSSLEPSEESVVEEMWAMSRSHWSLLQSIPLDDNELDDIKFPSYQQFVQLYKAIKCHCILRVSFNSSTHPFVSYTTKTLVSSTEMTDSERVLALNVMNAPLHEVTPANAGNSADSAIVLWRRATHFSYWMSSNNCEQHQDAHSRIYALLNKSYYAFSPSVFSKLRHSCAPTLLLTMGDDNISSKVRRQGDNLAWIALHDLKKGEECVSKINSLDKDFSSRSKDLKQIMGGDFICDCERCHYENGTKVNDLSIRQLKRIGDVAMQQGRYKDAASIYDAILGVDHSNADAFHAKAASYLGMASSQDFSKSGHCYGYFLQAQNLWNQATSNNSFANHTEMAVIIRKQRAYGTIEDPGYSNAASTDERYDFSSYEYLNGKVFLTCNNTPIISLKECNHVIQSAENFAKQKGWTTSRHYAVPTTDIPLHELTDLQSWFFDIWVQRIRPLLRRQFKLNDNVPSSKARDIFIHDAFVVRYDASGGQRSLPPHYDESTHR